MPTSWIDGAEAQAKTLQHPAASATLRTISRPLHLSHRLTSAAELRHSVLHFCFPVEEIEIIVSVSSIPLLSQFNAMVSNRAPVNF